MSNRIIITLTDDKGSFMYDLEVPNDLECYKLVDDIVQTIISYNPDHYFSTMNSTLYVPKLRTIMKNHNTLEEVGVFNGDYLVIR